MDKAQIALEWGKIVASIVSSLAWPLFALAIAAMFRNSIIDRIPFLKTLKAGSVSIDFQERLKEISEQVTEANQNLKIEQQGGTAPTSPEANRLEARLSIDTLRDHRPPPISPYLVIMDNWVKVYNELVNLYNAVGDKTIPFPEPGSEEKTITPLLRRKAVDLPIAAAYVDLRNLRNSLGQRSSIGLDDAAAFGVTASRLGHILRERVTLAAWRDRKSPAG